MQHLARECLPALGSAERLWLKNGQATVAALYEQYFKLPGKWHIIQGLGGECGLLVGFGSQRIDWKFVAWRLTREFLREVSHPDN